MANFDVRNRPTAGRSITSCLFFLTTLLGVAGCAIPPRGGRPALRTNITASVSSPELNQVLWGVLVVDPAEDRPLYSLNAQKKFVPASNMKLLPTATALSLLGPDYRYQTHVWGVGELHEQSGALDGDLVLRATGDPTLSDRFYPSAEAPLDSIADDIWDAGVRSISGALVVDVSAWDSSTVRGAWLVQNLSGTSGATGGAFAVGEGVLTIEVTGGAAPGSPASSRWWPRSPNEMVTAAFVTAHADSSRQGRQIHYRPESGRLRVEGRVAVADVDTIRISQREPVSMASSALLLALERRGIDVAGGLRMAWEPGDPVGAATCVTGPGPSHGPSTGVHLPDCPGAVRLATLTSPPMGEIVKAILEPSQNWMADQLVRTLGMELGEWGSWREGFRIQQEFLVGVVGVDSLDINLEDGSGMSPYNLLTPRSVVGILEYMRSSEAGDVFRDALASPGEEDSTLRRRLTGLEGRVFAKTGTLSHVTALSGYIHTESGRQLTFSILANNSALPSGLVRQGIDGVVETISRW